MSALRAVKSGAADGLRELLAERKASGERIDNLNVTRSRALSAHWAAQTAVTDANAALGKAKAAAGAASAVAMEAGGDGGDTSAVIQARRALHGAQDRADVAAATLKHLDTEIEAESNKVPALRMNDRVYHAALADYLAPITRKVLDQALAAETAARKARAILSVFAQEHALSGELEAHVDALFRGQYLVPGAVVFNGGKLVPVRIPDGNANEWRAALTKLRTDADAELPAL